MLFTTFGIERILSKQIIGNDISYQTLFIMTIIIIRVHFHDRNLVAMFLSQWRDNYYYEKGLQDKVNNHLSIRAVVNELNAFNIWRLFCSEKYQYHIYKRKAEKFRNKVLILFANISTLSSSCC